MFNTILIRRHTRFSLMPLLRRQEFHRMLFCCTHIRARDICLPRDEMNARNALYKRRIVAARAEGTQKVRESNETIVWAHIFRASPIIGATICSISSIFARVKLSRFALCVELFLSAYRFIILCLQLREDGRGVCYLILYKVTSIAKRRASQIFSHFKMFSNDKVSFCH